jgi:isoleucyl-tRNA synthetase
MEELGELDRWILEEANRVFAEMKASFDAYDFPKGLSLFNHFLTNQLSGIYLDICKDRLYCDSADGSSRRGAQSAMALIADRMMVMMAPILTYTVDEVLEYAPEVLKRGRESVFELLYEPLPSVESSLDSKILQEAREAFYEEIDRLKKEKRIKSTLELVIGGDISIFGMESLKDLEDWFVVSGVEGADSEEIGSFEVAEKRFTIHPATGHKCPRCWRFVSESEDEVCGRCREVLNG